MENFLLVSFGDLVKGNCKLKDYENYFHATNYNHSFDYNIASGDLFNNEATVYITPLSFTKSMDENSPTLYELLCNKILVHQIEIVHITKNSNFKITLTDCKLSNVSYNGVDNSDMTYETIYVVFNKITWDFNGKKSTYNLLGPRDPGI